MRFLLDTNSFFLAKPFLKEEVGKFLKSWQYSNPVYSQVERATRVALSTWLPVILRPLGSAYGRTKTGVKRIHMKNNLTIIYTCTRRIRHEYHHLIKATIRQSHNYDCIGRSVAYETYYFSPTHISSCLIPLDVLF